jgi:hypothetical protein
MEFLFLFWPEDFAWIFRNFLNFCRVGLAKASDRLRDVLRFYIKVCHAHMHCTTAWRYCMACMHCIIAPLYALHLTIGDYYCQ